MTGDGRIDLAMKGDLMMAEFLMEALRWKGSHLTAKRMWMWPVPL
jgi:hypothetical protein